MHLEWMVEEEEDRNYVKRDLVGVENKCEG